jgi:NTE family protein
MGLLSAVDIWSTSGRVPAPAKVAAPLATTREMAVMPDLRERLFAPIWSPESRTAAAVASFRDYTIPEQAKASEHAETRAPATALTGVASTVPQGEAEGDSKSVRTEEYVAARWLTTAASSAALVPDLVKTSEPSILQEQAKITNELPQLASAAEIQIVRVDARAVATGIGGRETISPPWPPRKLSLALQGGGSFGAFTWGVLERLLEEADCEFDVISGASTGAINAVLLANGLVEGGREGAHARLRKFWSRIINEASFRSLMLIGGYSPAGSAVAFGPALRSGRFDPNDLDPLREALLRDIDFVALRDPACPKLLVAATRVRDGSLQIFGNRDITADTLLASNCPPQMHGAVEIDGDAYWDGGYGANPPLVRLVQDSDTSDVLVVQVTPVRDKYIPVTSAAIDRRLDQIAGNAVLNSEIAALEWARDNAASPALRGLRLSRLAAEDEIEGLAQRSPVDLGRNFITLLHQSGRTAADRWLSRGPDGRPMRSRSTREKIGADEISDLEVGALEIGPPKIHTMRALSSAAEPAL